MRAGRFNTGDQHEPAWEQRASDAVEMLLRHLPEGDCEIGDFGAGNQRVKSLLDRAAPGRFRYSGYDLCPQAASVERIDLTKRMPTRTFDVAVCLGLLEYLPQDGQFPHALATVARWVVVSYLPSDGATHMTMEQRCFPGWVSHYTISEIERAFADAGFEMIEHRMSGTTDVWLWCLQ